MSSPRLDAARVVLAHPQLPAAVARALGIPPLEDAVLEVLDPGLQLQPLESIQVSPDALQTAGLGRAQVLSQSPL